MNRPPLIAGLAGIGIGIVAPALLLASSVVVPDDFPTLQSAIDSHPDTVLIREGDYPEMPLSVQGVALIGIGTQRPRLHGLAIAKAPDPESRTWIFERIDFLDRIEVTTPHDGRIHLSECRLVGLHARTGDPLSIGAFTLRRCLLAGTPESAGLVVQGVTVELESDTLDSGIWLYSHNALAIRDCWFRGGTGHAIELHNDGPLGGVIANNRIASYGGAGIFADVTEGLVVEDNAVEDCGAGVTLAGGHYGGIIARRNRIEDCGTGLTAAVDYLQLSENVVLRASGHGMVVDGNYEPPIVDRNVVGDCIGSGIVVRLSTTGAALRGNTLFQNGGSGIEIVNPEGLPVTVQRNLAAANRGWGLWTDRPLTLGCNDWFENGLGAVAGVSPDPTDLGVDPRFCDLTNADVSLASDSPLLAAPGCGQIGALGLGCGAVLGVAGPAGAIGPRLAIESIAPNPSRGRFEIAWSLPRAGGASLAVHDISGRQVALLARGSLPAGGHRSVWDGRTVSGPAAPGVYLVRLRHGGQAVTARLLLSR